MRLPARWLAPAVLLGCLLLRLAWPLADPPARLSWSNGTYTDPAAITLSAREAALAGEWSEEVSKDLVFYPLLNGLTWLAYRVFGVSRLVTQVLAALLGTVTAAACMVAVGRARGAAAGALAGAAVAFSFWVVMFSRVPLAENLVVALLAAACIPAMRAGRGAAFAAGTIAGAAACLGKAHAVAFAPALLVFLRLRDRSWGCTLCAAGGLALVFALWAALWAAPFRALIADQAARSVDLYGSLPVFRPPAEAASELLWTLRAGWLFHRMPVLGALGGLFLVGTLLDPAVRRRRLEDGTALFAFWFLAAWALVSALPYKAPRHFVPAAVPLVVAAACQLHEMARGTGPPRRGALLAWVGLSSVVAVDVGIRVLAGLEEQSMVSVSPTAVVVRRAAAGVAESLRSPAAHLIAALATAGGIALLWRVPAARSAWRSAFSARGVLVPVAGALIVQLVQLTNWAAHRSYAIEEAKESLDVLVGPDAVLLGQFAPLLVQDTRRTGFPLFGAADPFTLDRLGVTHVATGTAETRGVLRALPPGRTALVHRWPFRTGHLRSIDLHRIRGTAYVPTAYERGVDALAAGRPQEALNDFALHRRSGVHLVPEVPSQEARCLHGLGDLQGALARLQEALDLRATSPEDWLNLGSLLHAAGDPEGARRAWRRSLSLDPWDPAPAERLRRAGG